MLIKLVQKKKKYFNLLIFNKTQYIYYINIQYFYYTNLQQWSGKIKFQLNYYFLIGTLNNFISQFLIMLN